MTKRVRKFNLPCVRLLAEAVSVFNRTLKDMNLHFSSIWDKICTKIHTHNNVTGKILVISMSRRVTNGPGVILVGDGGEHTFKHIFT